MMFTREPWEFNDDRLATWRRTGRPSDRARRTAAHPAEALDMTVDERPVGPPEPSLPDRPPVRFDDLSRTP